MFSVSMFLNVCLTVSSSPSIMAYWGNSAPSIVLLLNTPFILLPIRLIPNDSPRFDVFLYVKHTAVDLSQILNGSFQTVKQHSTQHQSHTINDRVHNTMKTITGNDGYTQVPFKEHEQYRYRLKQCKEMQIVQRTHAAILLPELNSDHFYLQKTLSDRQTGLRWAASWDHLPPQTYFLGRAGNTVGRRVKTDVGVALELTTGDLWPVT